VLPVLALVTNPIAIWPLGILIEGYLGRCVGTKIENTVNWEGSPVRVAVVCPGISFLLTQFSRWASAREDPVEKHPAAHEGHGQRSVESNQSGHWLPSDITLAQKSHLRGAGGGTWQN